MLIFLITPNYDSDLSGMLIYLITILALQCKVYKLWFLVVLKLVEQIKSYYTS